MSERRLSHEELLLWLNHRIGEAVSAYVCVDTDSVTDQVMGYAQTLRGHPDIAGLYNIGEMFLDLRAPAFTASLQDHDGIAFVDIRFESRLRIVYDDRRPTKRSRAGPTGQP